MKKIIFFVFALSICSASFAKDGLYVGANVGFNNVWLNKADPLWSNGGQSIDKISTTGSKYSGAFGLQVGYGFSTKFTIQTGLDFIRQGNKYTDISFNRGMLDAEYTADYLHIPLLLRYTTGHDGSGFFVEAGPHVSLLQSATLVEKGTKGDTYDVKNNVFNTDMGLTIGLGISFQPNEMIGLTFGFRGIFGLKDINKLQNGTKITNGAAGLNLGVNYHF